MSFAQRSPWDDAPYNPRSRAVNEFPEAQRYALDAALFLKQAHAFSVSVNRLGQEILYVFGETNARVTALETRLGVK